MPGELWRVQARAGRETSEGTAVTPTRRLYWDALVVNPNRESRPVPVGTGTRDNVRGHTQGPFQVEGNFTTRIAPAELDEILELAIKQDAPVVTPMGATLARERTYIPGTVATATLEHDDAGLKWRTPGLRINSLTLTGSVDGEVTIDADLFGLDFVNIGALTGSPTERSPNFLDGWQGTFAIAAFGSSTFTSYGDLVQTYTFQLNNNLDRVYTLNDTLAANRISLGLLDITASFGVDATGAFADDIVTAWRADTKHVLRLQLLGPANGIESGQRELFQVEIPGAWTSPDMGGEVQGVRSYDFPFTYVYDSFMGAGIRIVTRTNRTSLWT
jgi:hypothetical protein